MPRVVLYSARYQEDIQSLHPLGLGYIASYAIKAGILSPDDIRIVDSVKEAVDFRPSIIGISSVSQVLEDAMQFAKECRKQIKGLYILGGYHTSLVDGNLPPEFDVSVIGEGEQTFSEFLSNFTDFDFKVEGIEKLNGIRYRSKNNRIISNPPRKLIHDLDSIPYPSRQKRYSDEIGVFTSRGCPCRCIYCAGPVFWGGSYRLRSSKSVIDEIAMLVNSENPREVAILDDLWMANKTRFREIVEGLEVLGIPQNATFRGFCRSNLLQEEDIPFLKRLNYSVVRFGAETGSERLLKQIKGSSASVHHHQRVIDLCHKHGLPCSASFMFGIPGETIDDLRQTIKFLRRNKGKLSISGFYYFNPMPGTLIYNKLIEQNLINANMRLEEFELDMTRSSFDWNKVAYFNNDNIPLTTLKHHIDLIRDEFAVHCRSFQPEQKQKPLRSAVM
jgi:anaerobic magnesium-protoporphyrin IX monomethyl ester cyclase